MTARGTPAPCSSASLAAGEALAGTAPFATAWLIIEQEGPYGPNALIDSHLPGAIGHELTKRIDGTTIKALLVRKPGPHADDHHQPQLRRVWWAFSEPGRVAMRSWATERPEALLDLNLNALAEGNLDSVHPDAVRDDVPLLAVCTNGRRDVCCALIGRPIAVSLSREPTWAGRVWESSHIGGHRFAPTMLVLPHGWVHGRFDQIGAIEVAEQARGGRVALHSARGRSSLPPAAQAADLAVRVTHNVQGIDDTRVTPSDSDSNEWAVATPQDQWTVRVSSIVGSSRPESCGQTPEPVRSFTSTILP